MKILVPNPFQSPLNPTFLYISPALYPVLFIIETIVSAGWETTAQKTPAAYPDMNVTKSWVPFPYSLFGFVKIFA
jgi:hypothetical protein